MFFIGIFSSIIPYLVIAGVYLLGIGLYSLDNRNKKLTSAEPDKEIILREVIKSADNNSIHYYSTDFFKSCGFDCLLPSKYKSFRESGKKLLCLCNPPLPFRLSSPLHFGRPPPDSFQS